MVIKSFVSGAVIWSTLHYAKSKERLTKIERGSSKCFEDQNASFHLLSCQRSTSRMSIGKQCL